MSNGDVRLSAEEQRFAGARCLLVASTGGHLSELDRLAKRWSVSPDSIWVTFDTPQSRSLLEGRNVHFIPYVPPRGIRQAVTAGRSISRLLREQQLALAVSTGAAVAISSHVVARAYGLSAVYIESLSRVDGPSLTGRLMQFVPGVRRYAQHSWGEHRKGWSFPFSILDDFVPRKRETSSNKNVSRIFVTLGTIAPYEFGELARAIDRAVPADIDINWQLGATSYVPSRGAVHVQLSDSEFGREVDLADLVVTHAGIGTLLGLLAKGSEVITVPRRRARGEHVDDHQTQIARVFGARGLVEYVELEELEKLLAARLATE